MAARTSPSPGVVDTSDREIVLSRLFDAPRELVFDAWTDPTRVAKWWGPAGFTTTTLEMDVRPGGVWRFVMHGPDGTDYPNQIVFLEVDRPHRFVHDHSGNAGGEAISFHTTITFEERGGQTLVTMKSVFPSAEALEFVVDNHGAIEGGKQHLERFAEYLANHRSVFITRTFDAPRELVFAAWTDPKLMERWHAPNGCTFRFTRVDMTPGGEFHSVIRTPDGKDCWCRGVYREIVRPERIVYTLAVADQMGNLVPPASVGMDPEWPAETVVTVTFTEHDGKTTLTLHQTVGETIAKRTGAHPSWLQMLDRLAETLTLR